MPASRIRPLTRPRGPRISRMMDSAVTLLPDPDSPTSATVSFGRTSKETSCTTACHSPWTRNEVVRFLTDSTGIALWPSFAPAPPVIRSPPSAAHAAPRLARHISRRACAGSRPAREFPRRCPRPRRIPLAYGCALPCCVRRSCRPWRSRPSAAKSWPAPLAMVMNGTCCSRAACCARANNPASLGQAGWSNRRSPADAKAATRRHFPHRALVRVEQARAGWPVGVAHIDAEAYPLRHYGDAVGLHLDAADRRHRRPSQRWAVSISVDAISANPAIGSRRMSIGKAPAWFCSPVSSTR